MVFLGIDLGTSALKAVLVDDQETLLGQATVPIPIAHPKPGWSEQDPAAWWEAAEAAVAQLRRDAPQALRQVRALGLSGQMHAAVLVDRGHRAIRPAMLWNDARAVEECAILRDAVPDLAMRAGVDAMPGLTAPKLLWLSRHEPEHCARIWKVLAAKDTLRLQLTGEAATDMSDAAGGLWLDEAARDYCDPILRAVGLERAQMPRLSEGVSPTGEVHAGILRNWGIDGPVVVAGGAGDAAAAAIGIGAITDGDAFVSLGTSAQFFVADSRYRAQPDHGLHSFAHGLPERWFRMAALLNGASCLEWAARLLGEADIEALLGRTEAAGGGPSRLIFLPYLTGERTPHNDPQARGVLFGLDPASAAMDVVQATLEGVAFSLAEAQACLQAAGVPLETVAVVGGGARSRFWMQILAHVLGRPVVRYAGGEKGPAFGAARLARMALSGEPAESVCVRPPVRDVLAPDLALHAAYAERTEKFRRLYQVLRTEFASA